MFKHTMPCVLLHKKCRQEEYDCYIPRLELHWPGCNLTPLVKALLPKRWQKSPALPATVLPSLKVSLQSGCLLLVSLSHYSWPGIINKAKQRRAPQSAVADVCSEVMHILRPLPGCRDIEGPISAGKIHWKSFNSNLRHHGCGDCHSALSALTSCLPSIILIRKGGGPLHTMFVEDRRSSSNELILQPYACAPKSVVTQNLQGQPLQACAILSSNPTFETTGDHISDWNGETNAMGSLDLLTERWRSSPTWAAQDTLLTSCRR
jgi:hypothetical protein